tara:strand:- start:170 stop:682 length:513 start_codon:yes stop_codon:yes gene_type:complete
MLDFVQAILDRVSPESERTLQETILDTVVRYQLGINSTEDGDYLSLVLRDESGCVDGVSTYRRGPVEKDVVRLDGHEIISLDNVTLIQGIPGREDIHDLLAPLSTFEEREVDVSQYFDDIANPRTFTITAGISGLGNYLNQFGFALPSHYHTHNRKTFLTAEQVVIPFSH